MKKVVLFIVVLSMFSFSSFSFAELKISVLDVNRVLASLSQLKEIQADLKKKFDPRGQELVNLQNTLRNDLDKYRQSSASIKGEDLKKEQQKIIDKNKKLQDVRASLQRDLVEAQKQAITPILKQVESVVGKIAKDQKIDLVVNKANTTYVNPQLDITDQVVAEMKKQSKPAIVSTKKSA